MAPNSGQSSARPPLIPHHRVVAQHLHDHRSLRQQDQLLSRRRLELPAVLDDRRTGTEPGRVPAGEIEAAVIDQLRAVFRQPEIVAGTWKAARAQDGEITEDDARDALTRLDSLWDELFPAEQARIAALLVKQVDIGIDGLKICLRMDSRTGVALEMIADLGTAA